MVAGLRTPFTKQGTALKNLRTVDLATLVVKELMARSELSPKEVTLCVYGQVVPSLDWLNLAREVVLRAGLPKDIDAYSVSRACATSIQALTSATEAILAGQHDVAVVGGADSMSDVPLGLSRRLAGALVEAQKARTIPAKLKALAGLSPRDLVPPVPGFSREPTTGEQMGEAAEKMAKLNGITRAEQDEIAHLSHTNAARAWSDGTYGAEVMHVIPPPYDHPVVKDNLVREDSTLDGYAKLAARVRSQARHHHRGQRLAAHRRRQRPPGHARVEGAGPRLRAARLRQVLGLRRGRPGLAAPHGARLRRAEGPRARRAHARRHGPRRHARGLRRPGRLATSRRSPRSTFAQERLGRDRGRRRGRPDEAQRERRIHRHRPPLRGDRRPHGPLHPARAEASAAKQHALLTVCAAGGLGAAVVLEGA